MIDETRLFKRLKTIRERLLRDLSRKPDSFCIENRQFLTPAHSIRETPSSPIASVFAKSICLLVILIITVGVFGKLDIFAEAPGRIQPVGRSKVIQPITGGKVLRIDVRDGQRVRVGQLLAELDPTEAAATRLSASGRQGELAAEIARRGQIAVAGRLRDPQETPDPTYPPNIPVEMKARETAVMRADLAELAAGLTALRARAAEANEQAASARVSIASHRQILHTLTERVSMLSTLQARGWASRSTLLSVQEDLDREQAAFRQSEGELRVSRASAQTLQTQIYEHLSSFLDTNAQAMRDAQNRLDSARQDLVKADSSLKHTQLISPIDGVIQQLSITTIGQVVAPGQQLMTIVPSKGLLEIEADMLNKDIGFVKVGQRVVIKVEAFPFSRYGVLTGRVTRVSLDAVTSQQEALTSDDTRMPRVDAQQSAASPVSQVNNLVYPVTIHIDEPYINVDGRKVRVTPGMSVTVEVKTGTRRAVSYLLSPITDVASEAAHER